MYICSKFQYTKSNATLKVEFKYFVADFRTFFFREFFLRENCKKDILFNIIPYKLQS